MEFLIAPERHAAALERHRKRRMEDSDCSEDSLGSKELASPDRDTDDIEDVDPKGRRGGDVTPTEGSLSHDAPPWWDFDEFVDEAPANVQRHCTDAGWLLFFVLACGGVVWVLVNFYSTHSTLASLLNFRDGTGALCQPGYIFFCLGLDELDVHRRICVPECPNATTAWVGGCYALAGYATKPFAYQLCRPEPGDVLHAQQMKRWLDVAVGRWTVSLMAHHVHELCCAMLFSLFSAYMMLYVLAKNAVWIVRTGVWILGWVPLLYGIYLSDVLSFIPVLRHVDDVLPDPPNRTIHKVQAAALVLFGLIFLGIAHVMKRSVDAAARCLALTYKCASQSRMLFHPMTMLLGFIALGSVLLAGMTIMMVTREHVADWRAERLLSVLLLFCGYWGSQATFATCEFVVIYTTATWCFQGGFREHGYVSWLDVANAHWIVCRYHFGSCIYGGFVISLARPVQLTVGCLISFFQMRANPLRPLIRAGCHTCLESVEDNIAALNKNAFNEVVLSGLPFMEAADKTQRLLQKNMTTRSTRTILNGATLIMQVLCVTINAAVSAAVVWYLLGPKADGLEVVYLVIAGAFIGGFATLPFMLFVDSISDTILYCFEICGELEKERAEVDAGGGVAEYHMPCMRWKQDLSRGCAVS